MPVGGVGNFFDELIEVFADGASGGDIFPLGLLAKIDIFVVARFEFAETLDEMAVFDDAATDTGGEGEIEATTCAAAGFGESSEIGVVFDVDGLIEVGA